MLNDFLHWLLRSLVFLTFSFLVFLAFGRYGEPVMMELGLSVELQIAIAVLAFVFGYLYYLMLNEKYKNQILKRNEGF